MRCKKKNPVGAEEKRRKVFLMEFNKSMKKINLVLSFKTSLVLCLFTLVILASWLTFVGSALAQQGDANQNGGKAVLKVDDFKGINKESLSVDDEIRKLEMPTFRNLRALRIDAVDSEKQKEDFLDLFQSINGVALLTLNYLDKTVASGLVSQSQMTDAKVSQQLLKQISWATNEIASPDRKQLFRDFNEKVEVCLASIEAGGSSNSGNNGTSSEMKGYAAKVLESMGGKEFGKCDIRCGKKATITLEKKIDYDDKSDGKTKKGLYEYCVCCAETVMEVSNAIDKSSSKEAEGKGISLWDKIFLGNQGGTEEGDEGIQALVKEAKIMRAFYGDILYIYDEDKDAGVQKTTTQLPAASIGALIIAVRDGYSDNALSKEAKSIFEDALPEGKFKGIYPSVQEIIETWPPKDLTDKKETAEYWELWEAASLGKILFAYDLYAWQGFGTPEGEDRDKWPNGWLENDTTCRTTRAFVSSWADASALSFLYKLHILNRVRVEELMTLSNAVSEYEKNRARGLIARVDRHFKVAEEQILGERFAENRNVVANMTKEKDQALAVSTLMMSISTGIPTDRSTSGWGAAGGL